VAVALLVLQTGLGHSALQAVGVTRSSPSFVELYFPDAQALPSTVPASGRLEVRFAIGNVGLKTRSLAWKVSENTGRTQLRLASGRSVVPVYKKDTVTQTVRIHCAVGRGQSTELLVSVTHSSARITLWLACPGRK
jgi:hypothetical protein